MIKSVPWAERVAVMKGDLGEMAVDSFLAAQGYKKMVPGDLGAHNFDRMYIPTMKMGADLFHPHWADVKCYTRRTHYADTGINFSHFLTYCEIEDGLGIPGKIYWVDENEQLIYGQWFKILRTPDPRFRRYPLRQGTRGRGEKVYFPLALMQIYARLPSNISQEIRDLNTRSYPYPNLDLFIGSEGKV